MRGSSQNVIGNFQMLVVRSYFTATLNFTEIKEPLFGFYS